MADPKPTTTSYVVLGLLALRPWSAYELAQQSERSLRWFFPRAERAVYLEVKRLVGFGWAEAAEESTGRRARSVYSITESGRSALAEWMAEPSATTQISSEAVLKVFLADEAAPGSLRATLQGARTESEQHLARLAQMAAAPSRFPERMPTNVLCLRFLADVNQAVRAWAIWAEEALATLEAGDAAAIEEQTRATLAQLESLGAAAITRP